MSSAVIALGILFVCIVLFLTEWVPSWVTAVLGCVLMVLTGVDTFDSVFSGFSNSIIVLLVGAMVVGTAMFETGVAQIIGWKVEKLSRGNARLFLLVGCAVAGAMSMFMSDTAVLAMFLPIIASACHAAKDMREEDVTLPVALAVLFGGSCTLIGCTPQLTANGLLEKMVGMKMGMWSLFGPGIILFAILLVYMQVWGFSAGRRIWGSRAVGAMRLGDEQRDSARPIVDTRKAIVMVAIVVLMVISYIAAIVPPAMTAICAALLCIFSGCCSREKALAGVKWEVVLFLGGCLALGNGLTSSGAGGLIGSMISGLLGDVASPMVVFAVLVIVTFLMSQFITNSTAIVIMEPIAISLCEVYGFSYMAFTVGIMFAACISFTTPLAASVIAMTNVAGYKFQDYLRYTWPLALLCCVAILIIVPLFYPLV